MKKACITEGDLIEALRIHGKATKPEEVKAAFLERNGDISVIPAKKE